MAEETKSLILCKRIRCRESRNHWMNTKRLALCGTEFNLSGSRRSRLLVQGRAVITCLACIATGEAV